MGRSPRRKAPHRMVNSQGAPVGSLEAKCGVNLYTSSEAGLCKRCGNIIG